MEPPVPLMLLFHRLKFRCMNLPCTHLSMMGGPFAKLCVPDEHILQFNMSYAKDVFEGKIWYFCEIGKEKDGVGVVKLHFDVDLEDIFPVTLDRMCEYAAIMQQVIAKFYNNCPQDLVNVIVSSNENTKTKSKVVVNEIVYKTGIHMNFINVVVTQKQALFIREACIAALRNKYGAKAGDSEYALDWSQAIDESVILSNGLRMIGAHKAMICPVCRNDKSKRAECERCIDLTQNGVPSGRGHVDIGRPYFPVAVLGNNHIRDEELEDMYVGRNNITRTILACSIRTLFPETIGFNTFTGAPNPAIRIKDDGKIVKDLAGERRWKSIGNGKTSITYDLRIVTALEKAIRAANDKWINIFVKDGFATKARQIYYIHVCGEGSSYCLNKKTDHNSVTIYFQIDRKGMYQKCFCKCPNTGCSKYKSLPFSMNSELVALLFGDTEPFRMMKSANGNTYLERGHRHALERLIIDLEQSNNISASTNHSDQSKRKR